jgi:hypothetical protein
MQVANVGEDLRAVDAEPDILPADFSQDHLTSAIPTIQNWTELRVGVMQPLGLVNQDNFSTLDLGVKSGDSHTAID